MVSTFPCFWMGVINLPGTPLLILAVVYKVYRFAAKVTFFVGLVEYSAYSLIRINHHISFYVLISHIDICDYRTYLIIVNSGSRILMEEKWILRSWGR